MKGLPPGKAACVKHGKVNFRLLFNGIPMLDGDVFLKTSIEASVNSISRMNDSIVVIHFQQTISIGEDQISRMTGRSNAR
jgi:hypothetical protein